jgi:hypothetical protein
VRSGEVPDVRSGEVFEDQADAQAVPDQADVQAVLDQACGSRRAVPDHACDGYSRPDLDRERVRRNPWQRYLSCGERQPEFHRLSDRNKDT